MNQYYGSSLHVIKTKPVREQHKMEWRAASLIHGIYCKTTLII